MSFNISSFAKAGLLAIGLGAGALVLYKNIRFEEIMKWKSKVEAEEITVKHFLELLDNDNNISLEKAILSFEDSKDKSLKEYSSKRGRKEESYYKCYGYLFKRAKDRQKFLNLIKKDTWIQ